MIYPRFRHLIAQAALVLAVSTPHVLRADDAQSDVGPFGASSSRPVHVVLVGDESTSVLQSTNPEQQNTGALPPQPAPVACVACVAKANTKKQDELTAAMKGAYKGVFYDNSYAYLQSPQYAGPYFLGDSFKGINDGKLDLGGEYRSRYHNERNIRGLGLTGNDDQFWLSRLRLFANYRITKNIRVYGEYLYADSGGEDFAARPIEENRGDAQNLFVDATLFDTGSVKMVGRVGRQELLLGAQRLVSPLDWANTRRTFDGYRTTLSTEDSDLDLFYTNPVNIIPDTAGSHHWSSSNNNRSFYGAYLANRSLGIGSVESYYLGYDNQDLNFSFHTLGSRLVGSTDAFLYELEGGVQFGSNTNGSEHGAGFFTAGLGRKLNLNLCGQEWTPTIWGWYDWASGGTSTVGGPGDDGFNDLFPLAHKYLGFMDLFGRRNINDVNMQFIAPLGKRVNALLWYHYFFLDQATTPYSVALTPYNPGQTAVSKDLGSEIDLLFTVTLNPRNSLLIGYSYFDSGDYYNTPGSRTTEDGQFAYTQYQISF